MRCAPVCSWEQVRGIPSRMTLQGIIPAIAAPASILIIFSTCLLSALAWLCGRNQPD